MRIPKGEEQRLEAKALLDPELAKAVGANLMAAAESEGKYRAGVAEEAGPAPPERLMAGGGCGLPGACPRPRVARLHCPPSSSQAGGSVFERGVEPERSR